MGVRMSQRRSWFVQLRTLVVLGSAVLVAAVAIGVALAQPQVKEFSATMVQTSAATYTYTLTNTPSSTQSLGSANVVVPSSTQAFSFSSVSVPATLISSGGKSWTAEVKPGPTSAERVIELRAASPPSGLAPGESLEVPITFAASPACTTQPLLWETFAKQANNFLGAGNDFVGTSPSIHVIGPLTSFTFATITSPKHVNTPFQVTVTARDACANPVTYHSGTATLSGLVGNPTYGTLSFSAAQQTGQASASVTPSNPQGGAQLTATAGSISGTSNAFDVQRLCTSSDTSCEASHPDGTSVRADVPPRGATLALGLSGPGRTFACGRTTYDNIGSSVLVVPDQYPTGAGPIEVTIQWSLVGAPPGSRVVCMRLKETEPYFSPSKCGRTPVPPCELSRTRTPTTFEATFLIAPVDPDFSLG